MCCFHIFLQKKINTACCMHHPLDLLFSMILYILLLWNISWMNSFDWRVVISWDATALTAIFMLWSILICFLRKLGFSCYCVMYATKPRWKIIHYVVLLSLSINQQQWYIDKITATNIASKTLVIIRWKQR